VLGLGGYQTAWTMLHRFRKAMVRSDRLPLHGLAQTFGSADNPSLVGGTFQRGPNGEFFTTENSGHYGTNWNDAVRSQFSDWLSDRLGLPVVHQTWNGGF
jgi:hypothetical protein